MAKAKKSQALSVTNFPGEIDLDQCQAGMLIEIPHLCESKEEGYVPQHVEARLDPHQGEALRRLFETLDEGGLRLKNGRRVGSSADAIRWLLEAIGEAKPSIDLEESEESGVGSSG